MMERHWNGQIDSHPTQPRAMFSIFSTGVRNAYDASTRLFVPYPSNLTDARGSAIPANRGWLFDSLSYQGFAPQFADGFSYFINRNTFDHDLYRANLEGGQKGTKPELPETLDFEYRKRPLDALHVEGIVIPAGETFKVLYPNAWGPGIHREIFFGWQRFADEVVIDANTGADQEFRFAINTTGFDWFNGNGPGRRRWDRATTEEFHGGFELQHLGSGKFSFIRPDFVQMADGSRVPVTIRLTRGLARAPGLVKILPASVQAQAVYPIRIGTVDSFFSGAGDGEVNRTGEPTWTGARNTTAGSGADATGIQLSAGANFNGLDYLVRRLFIPIDTSAIPDTSSIQSATLKTAIDGFVVETGGKIVFVGPTTQTNATTLSTADFDKCGSVNNPSEIAARAVSTAGIGTYDSFSLSSPFSVISKTGFTLLGLRMSNDVDNVQPAGNNLYRINMSEQTGTSQDPILEVTYTVPSARLLLMASD